MWAVKNAIAIEQDWKKGGKNVDVAEAACSEIQLRP